MGWKHTSRVFVLLPIYLLTDSVFLLLIGQHVIDRGTETALQYTIAALILIVLAIMVAGMMLDALRNMGKHADVAAPQNSERE
jgi:uncharacterized membrane protein